MTGFELEPMVFASQVCLALLSAGLGLSLWRLLRGPTLADRVVALDLIAVLVIGMISVDAVVTGEASLLRVATVVALLAFLGTIAFVRRIEKGRFE
jgi:multicomponent Na+:H+ antiporter subunit F